MKSTIQLQMGNQSGGIERILRVIRHRGFSIESLNIHRVSEGGHYEVTLDVYSERKISLLTKQLDKLFDVYQLNLSQGVSYARSA